jgi:hypothetical protein
MQYSEFLSQFYGFRLTHLRIYQYCYFSHSVWFCTHTLGSLNLLFFTSPLVLASNGACSFSWVPELSLCHIQYTL